MRNDVFSSQDFFLKKKKKEKQLSLKTTDAVKLQARMAAAPEPADKAPADRKHNAHNGFIFISANA